MSFHTLTWPRSLARRILVGYLPPVITRAVVCKNSEFYGELLENEMSDSCDDPDHDSCRRHAAGDGRRGNVAFQRLSQGSCESSIWFRPHADMARSCPC